MTRSERPDSERVVNQHQSGLGLSLGVRRARYSVRGLSSESTGDRCDD